MRAGPLSNSKVISLLNSYFVPVYTVNEDYSATGSAAKEEKAERNRIFQEGYAAQCSVGTVHVYLLAPDGHLLDTMHVAKAAKSENLIAMLEKTIGALKTKPGQPVVAPAPQSRRPQCDKDHLALHLVARSLDGRGAWSDFPVENWIVLSKAEQQKLAVTGEMKPGRSWTIDPSVAEKLLTHFYPATENNDVSKNRFVEQSLQATVLSVNKDRVRTRVDGHLKMQHSFYHTDDGKEVDATLVGLLDFEPGERRVTSLQLVTDKAAYGGGKFAVALRSVR